MVATLRVDTSAGLAARSADRGGRSSFRTPMTASAPPTTTRRWVLVGRLGIGGRCLAGRLRGDRALRDAGRLARLVDDGSSET